MDYLWSNSCQESSFDTLLPSSDFAMKDGMESISTEVQSSERRPVEKVLPSMLVSETSEILGARENASYNYRAIRDSFKGETMSTAMDKAGDPIGGGRELTAEETMRVAAARFIYLSAHTDGDPSLLLRPPGLSHPDSEEVNNVDLASLLLAAAEKVSKQRYDQARNLLQLCGNYSSITGNPVQRVVHYFSETLQERIHRETGRLSFKRQRDSGGPTQQDGIGAAAVNNHNHPVKLVVQQKLPFSQLLQFTSMQTIIDTVTTAKRIHLIDLSINHGLHWTILMQALATRAANPIEYLMISAIGTSEEAVTGTCKSLVRFAETLRLPFLFKVVVVPGVEDLKEEMFEVKAGEAVCVHSTTNMNSLITKPDSLENLMRVLRRMKPCIMTVMDVEGKHNSPHFIHRFTEALFYFSAFFDCIDSFMDRNDKDRAVLEGLMLLRGIRSIIASEGRERVVRHVGISVWRSFFARFGVVEVELNEWSPYLASLLVKQFVHGSSCTLDKNGKSLTIGWKGTPLFFVSAWKFPIR